MRSISGLRSWRRRGERQGLDEQRQAGRADYGLDQAAVVLGAGGGAGRGQLGLAGHIEHLAAGGLDEQGLLGAEVVGDLAGVGAGGGGDLGHRDPGKAPRLEQRDRRVEQPRAHPLAGFAHGACVSEGPYVRHGDSCMSYKNSVQARDRRRPMRLMALLAVWVG